MDTMEVAVVAIGALAGLLTGYLGARQASKLEYEKETRLSVAQVARGIGAAVHAILWLTWRARRQPQHLTVEQVEAFDKEMHLLYPELTGSLAQVAALNFNVYDKLREIVDKVYALDVRVAESTTSVRDGVEGAAALVAAHHDEANALERSLNEDLKGLMALSSRTGWGALLFRRNDRTAVPVLPRTEKLRFGQLSSVTVGVAQPTVAGPRDPDQG